MENVKTKQVHIRCIGKNIPKANRFIYINIDDHIFEDIKESDLTDIRVDLNKKYTLDTCQKMNVRISKRPYGLAFFGENDKHQLIFNPFEHKKILHFEGRTDWLTAGELRLETEFCLASEQNKTTQIIVSDGYEHIFMLDSDDTPRLKLKHIKGFNDSSKIKFVRIPGEIKDFSDWYNISNCTKEEVLKEIEKTDYYKQSSQSNIFEKDNCYYIEKKDGTGDNKMISDFVIELKCRYSTEMEKNNSTSLREIILKGQKTKTKLLNDISWVDVQKFKIAIAGEGEFNFWGNKYDFEALKRYLVLNYRDKEIKTPIHIGKIDDKTWLFENGIFQEGQFYQNDENDTAFINDDVGYSVLNNEQKVILNKEEIDLRQLFEDFYNLYGNIAHKMFGFSIATLFKDSIQKKFGCFPLLFFSGQSQSGKSRASDIMSSLLACQNIIPFNYTSTTKSIYRHLERFKNLLIRVNEYNANNDDQDKFLISIYDNEGYTRAKADNSLQTIKAKINSSCLFMSEFLPNREAVLNRTVHCKFSEIKKDKELFDKVFEEKVKFSNFIIQILSKINEYKLIYFIDILKNELYKELPDIDIRIIENYAIVYGSVFMFFKEFGFINRDNPYYYGNVDELKNDIKKEIGFLQELSRDSNIYQVFFDHLKDLFEKKELTDFVYIHNECLNINLRQCFYKIKEMDNKSTREIIFTQKDIKDYIQNILKLPYQKAIYRPADQNTIGGYALPMKLLIQKFNWPDSFPNENKALF